MTAERFKKSKCYKCIHGGMLDRLGWVKCYLTRREHLRPVHECETRKLPRGEEEFRMKICTCFNCRRTLSFGNVKQAKENGWTVQNNGFVTCPQCKAWIDSKGQTK